MNATAPATNERNTFPTAPAASAVAGARSSAGGDLPLTPADPEAERRLLGALLSDAAATVPAVQAANVGPEWFHTPQHRRLFAVIASMVSEGADVHLISVANAAKKNGDDDLAGRWIDDLCDTCPTAMYAGTDIATLRDAYTARARRDLALEILDGRIGNEGMRERLAEIASIGNGLNGWPELRRLGEPMPRAAFPSDTLPGPFREFVESVAEALQVPVDLPGVLALGAVAIACAKRFRVRVGRDHFEPTNLFLTALLPPGERKSASLAAMLRPVWEYEKTIRAEAEPAVCRAIERAEADKARIAELRKKRARQDDPAKRAEIMAEIEALTVGIDDVPELPSLVTGGDATPEALAVLAGTNGGRIAQVDAEAGALIRMFGAYQSNGAPPAIEFLLKAHAGDYFNAARVNRPGVAMQEPALTLVLCGQPEIFRSIKDKKLLRARGLLARFLVSLPNSRVGTRSTSERGIDPAAVARYADALGRMLATAPASPDDPDRAHVLSLSPEARRAWEQFAERIEAAQKEDGELFAVRDFASKLAGAVGRIAGILHVMAGAADEPITGDTMGGAVRLGDYFLDHWRAVHELADAEKESIIARRIVGWIERHPEAHRVSEAQLWRDLRHGQDLERPEDLREPLDELIERGYIKTATPPEARTLGGRPSKASYLVNPALKGG